MKTEEQGLKDFKSALEQMLRAYEKIMDKYDADLAIRVQCFMIASIAARQEDPNQALAFLIDQINQIFAAQPKQYAPHFT